MAASVNRFISARDGLVLHVADYVGEEPQRIPLVCLAAFAHNSRSFEPLAQRLVAAGHRVIAPDYRGCGLSAWDPDIRNYDMAVEQADLLAILTALEIDRAAFLGAGRGGLHVMSLAAIRPTLLAAAILNDIGPVVEPQGLMRSKVLLTNRPDPRDWAEAADVLRRGYGAQFTAIDADGWERLARVTVGEAKGRLFWDHDPALTRALERISPDMTAPDLWPHFEAIAQRPTMAIRGANSDMLSAATFAQMQARAPACRFWEVAGEGHAPLLADDATAEAIVAFLAGVR